MFWPSMIVVKPGNSFSLRSWARQSKPVYQYPASSRTYSTGMP
jgi:hypothetical protein